MKEDIQKFMELVKTDEGLQKKLEEAGKNYAGEYTEEAVFDTLIAPALKDLGLSFTLDEYKQAAMELDPDEMAQVSGGEAYLGGGCGWTTCDRVGAGMGWGASSVSGGLCFLVGLGKGTTLCYTAGAGAK